MEPRKVEWYEITEPCTKENIYVNMFTGECVWNLPQGVAVKKCDSNLWWEIFDPSCNRFYYYNPSNQKTVWQKPQDSDVLSLSKLQTLKESDPEKRKESTATQTTTKISAKNVQRNTKFQKSASTQTTPSSPMIDSQRIKHYSSLSEHTLSAYSYDSGCSADSSFASQSHSSLDNSNYHHLKKFEYCSAESVDSSYFQDQNLIHQSRPWQEAKHWEDRKSYIEFGTTKPRFAPQKPMLCDVGPTWQQHSFECWQAPSRAPPKQHSLDSSQSRRHASQQQLYYSKGRSSTNFPIVSDKKRSTPQHHRKTHPKSTLSFGLDHIKHASSYTLENNTAYPPEAVGTPLASRRRRVAKYPGKSEAGKSESEASSPQSPLMPLENLQPFKSSKSNIGLMKYSDSKSYKHQSLDLPLQTYRQGPRRKDDDYTSALMIPLPHISQARLKVSPDCQSESYNSRGKILSRRNYYNSCKQIYDHQSEKSAMLSTTPDFNLPCCYQVENYLSPLQQYLIEQTHISGNLGDMGDDKDSFSQSDDSDGQADDDDHFADDEGMSRHDSSSLEYLDNYRYFDEDYDEIFYSPVLRSSSRKGKSDLQLCSQKMQNGHKDDDEFSSSPVFSLQGSDNRSRLPSYYDSFGSKELDKFEYDGAEESASEGNGTSKGDIHKYAEDNLNRHTKGIFRKKFSIQDMLSWSKDPIRKPMISTTDKSLKRDACDIFKLIQTYMLDHKTKTGQTYEAVVLDIATRGWSKPALRDELYIQICRQTTDNPKRESLVLGWELMTVCLSFFPPSVKFQPYLEGYIKKHQSSSLDPPDLKISQYALVCGKRLEQISHKGAARSSRKPTVEEIEQSRVQIFRPSMFGNSLEEVMALQRKRYPAYRLPWIQTTLSEAILQLNGAQTEGIFRVPGDIDEINTMKMKIDQWEVMECDDPHVPASLLKQWYRELFEPLIPTEYYEECITYCNDAEAAVRIVKNLPDLNRLVFSYLIRFLQVFAAEQNCAVTKMDAKNLAMVMAPNCLRCTSEDPSVIFENTRKEMAFIQTLIQHLNTSYMEGII